MLRGATPKSCPFNRLVGAQTPDYARRSTRNLYDGALAIGVKGAF
jgi:hypothetical protein